MLPLFAVGYFKFALVDKVDILGLLTLFKNNLVPRVVLQDEGVHELLDLGSSPVLDARQLLEKVDPLVNLFLLDLL